MQCKNLKISSVTHFQYPTKHLTSEPHFQLDDTAERNLCCWHYWNIAAWPQGADSGWCWPQSVTGDAVVPTITTNMFRWQVNKHISTNSNFSY